MVIYELVKTKFNDKGEAVKELGHIKLNDYDIDQILESMGIVEQEAHCCDYTRHIVNGITELRNK